MVGEQITVKQLIEKRIIMRLSRHDHVYRHCRGSKSDSRMGGRYGEARS